MNLNELELNSIREVVGNHQTISNKLLEYSQNCQDPEIKRMFSTASQKAKQCADKLTQML